MNKIFLIIGFVLMVAAQWFVPGQMIAKQERVLTEGTAYKFKTQPIDPSDPLRGKYIRLRYEMDRAKVMNDSIGYNEKIYVYLKTDENGFAKATHATRDLQDNGQDYIETIARSDYGNEVYFDLPFTTFYMEESKAYDAEIFVREATRDSLINCYGLVYIKGDTAVLENVIVDNMPIKEYVEKHQKENAHKE